MTVPNCNNTRAVSEEQLVPTLKSQKKPDQKIKIFKVLFQVENVATNDGLDTTEQRSEISFLY